jgi:predicted PurR-regulated permease PerM
MDGDEVVEVEVIDAGARDMGGMWLRRGLAFTAGAAVVVGLVWLAAQAINVLLLVFVAILLAAGLEPVVGWLRAHLPVGRTGGILLAYGAFFVSVVLLAFVAVPTAINQLTELSNQLPSLFDQARAWAKGLEPKAASSIAAALVDSAERALRQAPPKPDDVVEAGLTLAEAVVGLITLLTVVFFWLTEHARLQRYALAFVPVERRAGARDAWNEVVARLGLWVRGQLTVMGSLALFTGILYTVVGLPSPLLLAIIAGLAEAIPLVGPIIGAIPAVVVAATVGPEQLAIVVVVYVIIQFVEGNILVPMIMRSTIGISPFLVIVSLLIGGSIGGILGAFLAVPIAAAVEVLLERLQAREVPVAQSAGEPEPDDVDREGLRDKPLDAPEAVSRAHP